MGSAAATAASAIQANILGFMTDLVSLYAIPLAIACFGMLLAIVVGTVAGRR